MKRRHSWAKGYEQREIDRQREKDQAALSKLRKEVKAMESIKPHRTRKLSAAQHREDSRDWETQEEIRRLKSQVDAYKKSWESEKEINKANSVMISDLRTQLINVRGAAILRGVTLGAGLGLALASILYLIIALSQ